MRNSSALNRVIYRFRVFLPPLLILLLSPPTPHNTPSVPTVCRRRKGTMFSLPGPAWLQNGIYCTFPEACVRNVLFGGKERELEGGSGM